MLEIKDLSKIYKGDKVGCADVTISIPPGEAFAILGTSGAGKTTLLQCLGRFLEPTTGTISLNGEDISTMDREQFRRKLGIVFQALNLFPHLTILENLTLSPTKVYGENESEVKDRAMTLLGQLGIDDLADRYPSQVSGGQAQRVAIGRSLILKPDYLLLDEPTSALDKVTTQALSDMLHELKTDTTFVFVTHDMPFARSTAKSGVLMELGKIKVEGTIQQIEEKWEE